MQTIYIFIVANGGQADMWAQNNMICHHAEVCLYSDKESNQLELMENKLKMTTWHDTLLWQRNFKSVSLQKHLIYHMKGIQNNPV